MSSNLMNTSMQMPLFNVNPGKNLVGCGQVKTIMISGLNYTDGAVKSCRNLMTCVAKVSVHVSSIRRRSNFPCANRCRALSKNGIIHSINGVIST